MADSGLPCPHCRDDFLQLVNILQDDLVMHVEPRQLADVLVMSPGQLTQMTAKHLLLIGNVAYDIGNGLLVGHLAGEGGGDFVPEDGTIMNKFLDTYPCVNRTLYRFKKF